MLAYALMLLQLSSTTPQLTKPRPEETVRQLYRQVKLRETSGIPRGAFKQAIWPYLSHRLKQTFETANACEADYYRQNPAAAPPNAQLKPEFPWLEEHLFSGHSEGVLTKTEILEAALQKNGTYQIGVRLSFRDPASRPSFPAYHWRVYARVIQDGRRFVVDDLLLVPQDRTLGDPYRLSRRFLGCKGPRWIGDNENR